jgi:biopolymer transport protein ExbB
MWHLLIKGGWMMLPLALCSLVSVTIIIDRFFFFRRLRAISRAEEVIGLVRKGRLEEALRITDETEGARSAQLPVMRVLAAGITHSFEPSGAMEAAAVSEVSTMKRGLVALDTIITLSPLLGLLGTIIGMINAFNVMAAAGLGQPHAVTGGVAEALIATAAGISVAVITLIPYNYFLSRVEGEMDVMETHATRLELAFNPACKE